MKNTVHVALSWSWFTWHPDDTKKRTEAALVGAGVNLPDLDRSVYVIRLAGDFCVLYPGGDESPTVYIGEGDFQGRIDKHRQWAAELAPLIGRRKFQVGVATPRVQNCPEAYMDCEAVLLQRFADRFGIAPLWNKQLEKRRFEHHEYSTRSVDYALCKRSDAKYKWAVRPMKSSVFHASYGKGGG